MNREGYTVPGARRERSARSCTTAALAPVLVSLGVLSAAAAGGAAVSPASAAVSGSARPGAAPETQLSLGDFGPGSSEVPIYAAIAEGFFKKNGLNVKLTTFEGGGSAGIPALTSGSIDGALTGAADTVTDLAKGVISGKFVMEISDNSYDIVAQRKYSSIKGLKGATAGIAAEGGSDQVYIEAVLKHFGVPASSITYVSVGSATARLASLTAGKVDFIAGSASNRATEKAVGRILLSSQKSPVSFPGVLVFFSSDYLKDHAPAVKAFVKSLQESTAWVRKNSAKTVSLCEKYGSSPAKLCSEGISFLLHQGPHTWSKTGAVNVAGLKNAVGAACQITKAVCKVKAGSTVDASYTQG